VRRAREDLVQDAHQTVRDVLVQQEFHVARFKVCSRSAA
jgi:hypothetical protein